MASPADAPATVARLHALRERGALSWAALWAGLRRVEPRRSREEWRTWLLGLTLSLGVLCLFGGSAYYVVVNWAELGRFGQIGLALASFLAAAGVAARLGTEGLGGRLATSAAAGLIGALLSVLATVYSTGGHVWPLLLTWFLLMTPFVLAARWAPLVVGWWVVANLTVLGGLEPILELHRDLPPTTVALALAGVNAAILGAWEILAPRVDWLADRWPRRVVGVAAWTALVVTAIPTLTWEADGPGLVALPLMAVGTAIAQLVWWRKGRDLLLAGAPLLAWIVAIAIGGLRVLIEIIDDELLVVLCTPLLVVALLVLSVGALAWLRFGLSGHEEDA